MNYRFRMNQEAMQYSYEGGKARMNAHPYFAKKQQEVLKDCTVYKTEKEALEAAIKMTEKEPYSCQIWAEIELADGIYRIRNYWIATDNIDAKVAADYVGMALMYDETRINKIIQAGVDLDEVVAYD